MKRRKSVPTPSFINEDRINSIVKSITESSGDAFHTDNLWSDLFHELDGHKKYTCRKLVSTCSSTLDRWSSEALYEDAVMGAVLVFTEKTSINFMAVLQVKIKDRLFLHRRSNFADKRVANWNDTVEIDGYFSEGDGKEYTVQTVDDKATDLLSDVEETISFKSLLEDYKAVLSERLNEQLLILEVLVNNSEYSVSENKENILSVLPEGTTWVAARKKLERARKSFREFYIKQNIAV